MSTRQERPLGLLEKYQTSKHLTRAYGNICMTTTLEHGVNGEATTAFYMSHFQPALTRLIETHAALSMVVRDSTESTIHFEQLTSIDLGKIVTIETDTMSIQELIKEQTTTEFNLEATLPLWRIKIVVESPTTCKVSLALHHIIGDGMSLCIIWNDLLQELNKEIVQEEKFTTIPVKHLKLPLPYELSNAPQISIVWDVIPVVLKSLVPKVLPVSIARLINPLSTEGWKGDFAAVEEEPHDTEVRIIHVPFDIWKPITVECKKRGISPHAIVFVSMMLAWNRLYPDQTTEVATPINCRASCHPPVPNNVVGNYVGAYTSVWTHKQLTSVKDIWKIAKKYHQDLQSNKIEASKQSLFLKFLPEYPASYCDYWYDKRKNSSMGRTGGLELSDLGRFNYQGKAWKLNEMYFCQSAQTFTAALGMNSIAVNDELYCTLGWQNGALELGKINMYHDTFIGILKDLPL